DFLRAGIAGLLLRRLLRIQALPLDTLGVELRVLLLRVLRGDVVAVVHDALIVDPPVSHRLAGRGGCGPRPGGGQQEQCCESRPTSRHVTPPSYVTDNLLNIPTELPSWQASCNPESLPVGPQRCELLCRNARRSADRARQGLDEVGECDH